MNKTVLIATILTVSGIALALIGLSVTNFDFASLSNAKTVITTHEITQDFQSISIETDISDISFVLSDDDSCKVVSRETDKQPVTATVSDGKLIVKQENHRKWYDYIGIFWPQHKLTVYLPKAEYETLSVSSDTGRITVSSDFSFDSVDVKVHTGAVELGCTIKDSVKASTTTGNLTFNSVTAKSLNASCSNGKLTLSNVNVTDGLQATTSTGDLTMTSCAAGTLELACSTGDIVLTNTTVAGQLQATTSTGEITLSSCDAESLVLKSDTGDISGTLLTEKIIFAETDTGRVTVPHSTNGGSCQITTDTGNITIRIES